jgi:hypothetical protein
MVLVAGDSVSAEREIVGLVPVSRADSVPDADDGREAEITSLGAIGWRHCAELGLVIVVALGLALGAPLTTAVYALILFGVLHNYFEIRYLAGRFGGLLGGHLGEWVLGLLTVIVLVRALPLGTLGRPAEIVAGYLLLAGVLVYRIRHSPYLLMVALGVVAVATVLSLTLPDHHFVVITHLHNVLPLAFIWEWSAGRIRDRPARLFLAMTMAWALVLPALLLSGLVPMPPLSNGSEQASIFASVIAFLQGLAPSGGTAIVPTVSLPSFDSAFVGRLLTIFAFLQLLHYYVWCRFFPRVGAAEARRADARLASVALPGGRKLTLIAIGLALVSIGLFWTDLRLGRSVYGALAGYHAYLEYVVLLLFVLGAGGSAAFRVASPESEG